MPSVGINGARRRVDEPLTEISADTGDGKTLSLFVRWDDRDKAHELICDGVAARFRADREAAAIEGA